MNILSRLKAVFLPSIDTAIADLTKAADRLRDLAVQHEQHAVARAKSIAAHVEAQVFHNSEADRARRVATKIEKLVA